MGMDGDVERVILDEEQIKEKVKGAAKWLDNRLKGADDAVAVCILRGAAFFFCDLVRAMKTPLTVEFVRASSYGNGSKSTGKPTLSGDNFPVEGRDVVLVEDIVDSGRTLSLLREIFLGRGAKSVTTVALFDKPSRRVEKVCADYACAEIDDLFIVGYGLDYAQRYRTLPYVGVLKKSVYGG